MIFKTEEQEEELVIGEIETVESNIDIAENLAFVLDTVSSKFYSDPIGSIVREITSNCFDAHVEAGVDEPVVIKLYYNLENDGYIIEFIDRGVGMNTERFNKIYMNWFSSTKRLTNTQIGAWGLGSKSPFSYTNQFMITSIADGIKTTRILSKIQGELPKAETIYSQPSDEHNGTTIKIDIKSHADAIKFEAAIKDQLAYFDNVFVDASSTFKFDNDYRIYDCRTFKYRSGSSLEHFEDYSVRAESQTMHILLGNVKYPINWTVINMHPIKMPVGVKFNIGELSVTPNREAIEYREESIELIKERVKLAKNEIKKIFEKQNPVVETFDHYLRVRNETPRITFKPDPESPIKDYLFVKGLGTENKICFLPLKNIERLPDEFFFEYKIETIENGLVKEKRRTYVHNEDIIKSRIRTAHYAVKGMTKYGNLFIRDGRVIVKEKIRFKDIREKLGYYTYRSRNYSSWYKSVSKENRGTPPKLGSAYAVYNFRKFVEGLVSAITIEYPTVSEQWIKDFKRQLKEESNQTRRKQNELVITYQSNKGSGDEVPIHSLMKSRWVFYAMRDDYESIQKFHRYRQFIANQNKVITYERNKVKYSVSIFSFYLFNKTNFKQVKHLENLVHINDFFKVQDLQSILNRLYLATLWNNKLSQKMRLYETGIKDASPYYYKLYRKVESFIYKYKNHEVLNYLDLLKENIVIKNHKCTAQIRLIKKEFESFLNKADVLAYISGLPEQYAKILVNHSLKITKLDYVKYGKQDQLQANRPEPNRKSSRWRTNDQTNSGQSGEGQSSSVGEGSSGETNQSEYCESGESIHTTIERVESESGESEISGESSNETSQESGEEVEEFFGF